MSRAAALAIAITVLRVALPAAAQSPEKAGCPTVAVADALADRADSDFRHPEAGFDDESVVLRDAWITSDDLAGFLRGRKLLEVVGCRVAEFLQVSGSHGATLIFRRCHFRGTVAIRSYTSGGDVVFEDCLFEGNLELLGVTLERTLRVQGCRVLGELVVEGVRVATQASVSASRLGGPRLLDVRSGEGLLFEGSCFSGRGQCAEVFLGAALRFNDCAWDRDASLIVSGGSLGGGLRFEGCRFDARLGGLPPASNPATPAVIRLWSVVLGGPLLIEAEASAGPRYLQSKSVVPLLIIPEWSVSRHWVNPDRELLKRGPISLLEDYVETLAVVTQSYQQLGRVADARTTRRLLRRQEARLRGALDYVLVSGVDHFVGHFVYWGLGLWLLFSILHYRIERETLPEETRAEDALSAPVLAFLGFFRRPPDMRRRTGFRRWVAQINYWVGVGYLAILSLAVQEALQR